MIEIAYLIMSIFVAIFAAAVGCSCGYKAAEKKSKAEINELKDQLIKTKRKRYVVTLSDLKNLNLDFPNSKVEK